jgi:hypothetical protein
MRARYHNAPEKVRTLIVPFHHQPKSNIRSKLDAIIAAQYSGKEILALQQH